VPCLVIFLEPAERSVTVSGYRAELHRCRQWHLVTATFTTPQVMLLDAVADGAVAGSTVGFSPRPVLAGRPGNNLVSILSVGHHHSQAAGP
jgi:hypothetical protein